MTFAAVIPLALKTSLALIVFGLGLHTNERDLLFLPRHPGLAARSFLAMSVIMPLLALSVAVAFGLPPAVKVALVALSMSPVPPFLPNTVMKAGGEASYTVGLLAGASIASIVVIPVTMWLLGRLFGVAFHMSPGVIARLVAVGILAPLAIGIALRHLAPTSALRLAKLATLFATIVLVLAMIPMLIKAWPAIKQLLGNGTLLAIIALALAGVGVGHLLGGPLRENRTVLALACASRHPAVALAIAKTNDPGDELVPAAILLALIVASIASAPYTLGRKRHTHADAPASRTRAPTRGATRPAPMTGQGKDQRY